MTTQTQTINCYYADCCYSDYLQDSYSRENQLLLVAPAYSEMTIEGLVKDLQENFKSLCTEKVPESITTEQVNSAIAECFADVTKENIDKLLRWVDFPEDDDEEGWADFELNFYVYLEW